MAYGHFTGINNFRKICLISVITLSVFTTTCSGKKNTLLADSAKEFLYVLENKEKYNAELKEAVQKEIESFKPGMDFTPSAPPAWEHQLFLKTNLFIEHYEKYGDLSNVFYKKARKDFDKYVSYNAITLADGRDCKILVFPNGNEKRDVDSEAVKSCKQLSEEKNNLLAKTIDSYRILAKKIFS